MARPIKEGLDYYPLDVNFENDPKIEIMRAVFGNDGLAFAVLLWARAYKTPDGRLDVSSPHVIRALALKCLAVSEEKFMEMLTTSLDIGLFDKDAYGTDGVLTSNGIQKRRKEIVDQREKWRKKKHKEEPAAPGENPGDSPDFPPVIPGENIGEIHTPDGQASTNGVFPGVFPGENRGFPQGISQENPIKEKEKEKEKENNKNVTSLYRGNTPGVDTVDNFPPEAFLFIEKADPDCPFCQGSGQQDGDPCICRRRLKPTWVARQGEIRDHLLTASGH
jgi:hypothetical protein